MVFSYADIAEIVTTDDFIVQVIATETAVYLNKWPECRFLRQVLLLLFIKVFTIFLRNTNFIRYEALCRYVCYKHRSNILFARQSYKLISETRFFLEKSNYAINHSFQSCCSMIDPYKYGPQKHYS